MCRICKESRDEEAKLVRYWEKERAPGSIEVDWDKGTATHTCHSCSARATITTKVHEKIQRRHLTRKELRWRHSRRTKSWIETHPEEHAANRLAMQEARRKAPRRERSAREVARHRLGLLALDPQGKISLCVFCRKILFVYTPDASSGTTSPVGRFHRACWLNSSNWGKWQAACRAAIRSGKPIPAASTAVPPPVIGTGSDSWLATAYKATLLYFWQRERSRRAFRDEDDEPRSVAWLSTKEGRELAPIALSHKGLYETVKQFLRYLPDESGAAGKVKIWREVFLVLGEHLLKQAEEAPIHRRTKNSTQVSQT